MGYFKVLLKYDWELVKSPAGAHQWLAKDVLEEDMIPDAHRPGVKHRPMMTTADLSLKFDPAYEKISRHFAANPDEFADAYARAWFKLTHRDMGPRTRYLGAEAPKQALIWQDPVPTVDHALVDAGDVAQLKQKLLASGLTTQELVRPAWAAAASYRGTDRRGGANGGRLRLDPQKGWAVNNPAEITKALTVLEGVQKDFNRRATGGKKISMADLIVLGGAAGIEESARRAGQTVSVPFTPGRTDASQAQTDTASFAAMEPTADGFRNFYGAGNDLSPAEMLVERAYKLNLTVPEMTVLVGGMRALDANTGGVKHGVFTDRPGQLTNDYFVNLVSMSTAWSKSPTDGLYEGRDRKSGQLKWTATPVDLIFGSHSQLRALAEVYGQSDASTKFASDFVAAWVKVMNVDRFDLRK
jgi:catalase-peroxidase